MRLCFPNQFSGFHTTLFLRPKNTKSSKHFRCTCQLCGLICASTTKLQQHVAKKTCQKRQKEAVEQGVTPSEFPSPPPSKLFAFSIFNLLNIFYFNLVLLGSGIFQISRRSQSQFPAPGVAFSRNSRCSQSQYPEPGVAFFFES